MKAPIDRFFAKVEKTDGCWLWKGHLNDQGYGCFRHDGRRRLAHIVGYQLLVGPIPTGLQLDHLCRVRRCVRPEHLEPVTPRVNVLRGEGPSAKNAQKTHCIHGHALEGANVYRPQPTHRVCNPCRRLAQSEKQRRRPEWHTSKVLKSQKKAASEGRCPRCGRDLDRVGYLCSTCQDKYNAAQRVRRNRQNSPTIYET